MSRKKRKHRSEERTEEPGEAHREELAAGTNRGFPAEASEPLPPNDAAQEPAAELERLRREASEMRELAQRTQAEFENFRRRMERERSDLLRYASAETVREFLPVLDNLERAIRAGKTSPEEPLRAGVEIILKQLQEILARLGVTEVEGRGKPFDPHQHEAVSRIETDSEPDGTILEVFQKGYWFKDRLLRPAMVAVSRRPDADGAEEQDAGVESTASEALGNSE